MRPVTVQFLKNPNHLHWGFEGGYMGEDDYGRWISVPAGSRRWKGHDEVRPTPSDAVFCAPHDGWWHLHYNGANSGNYSLFVDINTPPRWVGENRYEMIDLDLDVAMTPRGVVHVEDEDEFEVHQVEYGYTAEMIQNARTAAALIVEALTRGDEPFFDVAEAWLRKV